MTRIFVLFSLFQNLKVKSLLLSCTYNAMSFPNCFQFILQCHCMKVTKHCNTGVCSIIFVTFLLLRHFPAHGIPEDHPTFSLKVENWKRKGYKMIKRWFSRISPIKHDQFFMYRIAENSKLCLHFRLLLILDNDHSHQQTTSPT